MVCGLGLGGVKKGVFFGGGVKDDRGEKVKDMKGGRGVMFRSGQGGKGMKNLGLYQAGGI